MGRVEVAQTETNGQEVLETREWVDSLDYVLSHGGPERAGRLLQQLALHARREAGVNLPFTATTPYQNTIPARQQAPFPGSQEMERRIKSLVRWNALAMVVRANKIQEGIGGHISTFASAATLYEVAFNHFFQAQTETGDRDIVYFQGHGRRHIYNHESGWDRGNWIYSDRKFPGSRDSWDFARANGAGVDRV